MNRLAANAARQSQRKRTMNQRFACIMAGGSGTRFWPQSRAALPKQFLSLEGSDESLLQASIRRIQGLIPIEHVFVVTSHKHVEETARQLPNLPKANILGEPLGRNTAPCVGWAAAHVHARDPDGVMAVLPADPYITDDELYVATLERAMAAAEGGALVTIGIEPSHPETGYGYIERGATLGEDLAEVSRFVEKPDRARAEEFVARGMLWNSGMFFFRADAILAQIEAHVPDLGVFARDCEATLAAGSDSALVAARYAELPSVSIDNGVMEKADNLRVVTGRFAWHDVGSWTSAWELAPHDAQGNAQIGEAVMLDTRNSYVRGSKDKVIAVIGMDDLIVVDTPDALLVAPRARAQDVKKVVETLRARIPVRFV